MCQALIMKTNLIKIESSVDSEEGIFKKEEEEKMLKKKVNFNII